jgi:hypothetical protein
METEEAEINGAPDETNGVSTTEDVPMEATS